MAYLFCFYLSTVLLVFLWSRRRLQELGKSKRFLFCCCLIWLPAFLGGLLLDLIVGD